MRTYKHWAVFNIETLEDIKELPFKLKQLNKELTIPTNSILVNVTDADDKTEAFNRVSHMFPEHSVNVGVIPKHDL